MRYVTHCCGACLPPIRHVQTCPPPCADAPPSPPRSGDAFGSTELPAEVRSEDESAPGEADADFQSAASSDDGDTSDGVEAAFADLMTTGAFADGGGAGDTSGDDEDGGGAASDGDGSPDPPPRRAARLVDRRAITAYIQRALMAADDGPRRCVVGELRQRTCVFVSVWQLVPQRTTSACCRTR